MGSSRRLSPVVAILLVSVVSSQVAAAAPPTNDDFGSATQITSLPYSPRVDASAATRSASDPGPYCFSGVTVWFVFTSPTRQMLQASTAGSDYAAGLEVYRQTESGLQLVTCSYDPSMAPVFQVETGDTYYFMVGPSATGAADGILQLNVSSLGTPPANDVRSGAIDIAPGTIASDSTGATSDSEDYGPCYVAGATVWYRFVAMSDGRYRASLSTTAFNALINVKELTDGGLLGIACINAIDSPVFFPVVAGRTYYLLLGNGFGQVGGPFQLTFAAAPEIDPVVTIDPTGSFGRATGAATITGTIRCNETASFALGVLVDQRRASGSTFQTISCGPTTTAWSAIVSPSHGAFVPGPSTARAAGTAFTVSDYDPAQEVSTSVKLLPR